MQQPVTSFCIAVSENITIGDTIRTFGSFEALPFVKISEPTVEMTFSVNDSPFAGRGPLSLPSIKDRLFKELLKDVLRDVCKQILLIHLK